MRPWTAAVALLVAACTGGSETGNPVAPIEVALVMGAYSSDPDAVGISSGTAGTVIDEAWVSFGDPVLESGDCTDFHDFDEIVSELEVADLAQPVNFDLAIEAGSYCGMLIPLQPYRQQPPAGAPDELFDSSIVLIGRRADDTPFVLTHHELDELELHPLAGELPVSGDDRLLLFFDVATWMDGVDLDGAEVGDDGIIRIDDSINRAQWSRFEDVNLECSMEMFVDADEDGQLGESDPRVATCPPN